MMHLAVPAATQNERKREWNSAWCSLRGGPSVEVLNPALRVGTPATSPINLDPGK